MTDIELCAQMTLMKELITFAFINGYRGRPEAFADIMAKVSDRFRYQLQAPEHATADDADWLQALQSQVIKDTEKFQRRVLEAIHQDGDARA